MSASSNKLSESTTQETGTTYSETFSDGFIAQNANKIVNGTWLGEEILVKIKQNKRDSKGKEILDDLGDVDFLARTTVESRLIDFFPTGVTCDKNKTIPKDCDLYIEVTSMTGEQALTVSQKSKDKLNKVEHKKRFYENLFSKNLRSKLEYDQSVLNLDYENKMVLFVYYGREFRETSQKFFSDIFDSSVIHLPNKFCIRWFSDYNFKESEKKLKELQKFAIKSGLNIKDIFPDLDTEDDST